MSSKTEGSSHPILDRFLENPAEVFPPQQKSFAGRFISRVILAGADAQMHTMETDAQIRAMASEVKSYHRASGDKIENLDLKLIAQKINSLDVEESQKEAIHKLITKTFMKSMYGSQYEREINFFAESCAAQDIDDFIKKNDKTTCDIFMQVLQFLEKEEEEHLEGRLLCVYGKNKEDLIKFSMALLQDGTCNAFIFPNSPENNTHAIHNLLMLIKLLGTNEKELCEVVKPVLQRITLNDGQYGQRLLTSIIDKLALIPTRQGQQLLEDVTPLLQQSSLSELANIISALVDMASVDRKQALKDTAPLVGVVRPHVQAYVAKAISSIHPSSRPEIIDVLCSNDIPKSLLNTPEATSKTIMVIREIGLEKFTEVLRDVAPIKSLGIDLDINTIVSMANLSKEVRKKMVDVLCSKDLPKTLLNTTKAASETIRVIGEIGLEKFTEVLRDVAPTKSLGIDLDINTIVSIANLPQEVRKKMANAFSSADIRKDLLTTHGAVKSAIEGVAKIGLDNFIEAYHDATPLLNLEGDQIPSHVKVSVVMMVAEIPPRLRQKMVDALCSANTPPFEKLACLASISANLSLIPPEYIEKHLERWIAENGSVAPILRLLVEDEQSREALHSHLMQALEKAMISSPESASKLAHTILNHRKSLGFHDEHPLYQQAINVKILTDPESMKNPKNPYMIYNSLLKGEPLVDFPVPSVKIEESLFCSFDVQGLQSARKKLTFADLPNIDKQFLKKSFASLEARMHEEVTLAEFAALATEMQEEVTLAETEQDQKRIKEISEEIEAIEYVKANVLDAVLIPSLLKIEGKPHEPVPQSLFQLYTVIAYLTTLSTERKEGEMLSEQEDELMLFAQCIVNCKTGQEDGLAEYYNGVLAKGFSNLQATEGSSLEAVKRFAEISVQALFGKALADENVLRKVMGFSRQQAIPQLVHQLGYWKNKTYELIGLQHTVTFDQNSGLIMNELINKSGPELAEATLKEISLSEAVDDFLEKVNQALQASGKPAIGMIQIYDVLKKQLGPQAPDWDDPGDDNKGPGTRYFTFDDFDDYGTPTGITRVAAAHLLIAAHYGKQTA